MGEDPSIEPSSLEYIEDSYLPKLDNNGTPSLDEITEYDYRFGERDDEIDDYDERDVCQWSEETDLYLRSLTIDQILDIPDDLTDEMQTVETEFSPMMLSNGTQGQNKIKNYLNSTNRLRFFTRKKMREVKVTFVDFSKPYLAKISSGDNYKKFLNIGNQQPGDLVYGSLTLTCLMNFRFLCVSFFHQKSKHSPLFFVFKLIGFKTKNQVQLLYVLLT